MLHSLVAGPGRREAGSVRTRLALRPGQRGTKKLQLIYGDRLLCVRYRYDEATGRRLKTVELIVSETAWAPGAHAGRIVGVRIRRDEVEARLKAIGAGAAYDGPRRLFLLPMRVVRKLGFEGRVVP
jgi:hypothetical protein